MSLVEAAQEGDIEAVLAALASLGPDELAAAGRELDELYPLRDYSAWPWRRNNGTARTVSMACLGTRDTPEAAARWLVDATHQAVGSDWATKVVRLRPAGWQCDFVAALDRYGWRGSAAGTAFEVAEDVVRSGTSPLPTTDTFVRAWLDHRRGAITAYDNRPGRSESLARFRKDDLLPRLLPLALKRPAVPVEPARPLLVTLARAGTIDGELLARRTQFDLAPDGPGRTTAERALGAGLTDAERADLAALRRTLARERIERLLADGTRPQLERPLTELRALALTPAENVGFLREHVAMLDLSTAVATYGQDVLVTLDAAGLVEGDVVAEASGRVLLRAEKKLVRDHLSWLGQVGRRGPQAAAHSCAGAALAFGHPDVTVQEAALTLAATLLPDLPADAVAHVRDAAEGLDPVLVPRAREILGVAADGTGDEAEPWVDILPEPGPEPAPGSVETAAEVAQELAAVLADVDDVMAFERAIDGLVRHAWLDRDALSAALGPVMRRVPGGYQTPVSHEDLFDVAAAVRGDEPREWHLLHRDNHRLYESFPGARPITPPPVRLLRARLAEAVELVQHRAQPFLLARPTTTTGAVDPAVLVERVAELERNEVDAAPVDLAQALLRADPAVDDRVRRAARALRSDAGRRLARWLDDGGLAHRDTAPDAWREAGGEIEGIRGWSDSRWLPVEARSGGEPRLPEVAAAVVGPYPTEVPPHGGSIPPYAVARTYWVAQLPHHRDEVAAHVRDAGGHRLLLHHLASSGGPAGYAMHWELAFSVGRGGSAAPMLLLAAQGALDAAMFGVLLQAIVRMGEGSGKYAADSLRDAAGTGAYRTVWSVLEAALPGLLHDRPVREAGAFLGLAAECAARCGATGVIPEVDATAARKGSTRTIRNARLLRDVLGRAPV